MKEGIRFITYPCIATIKYDGEYQEIEKGIATNKYGRKRQLSLLTGLPEVKIFAELIREEGKDMYNEFLPYKEKAEDFKVVLFDCKKQIPYIDRLKYLKPYTNGKDILLPEYKIINDREGLLRYFSEVVKRGYEGIVCDNYIKLKHTSTLDLAVLGMNKKWFSSRRNNHYSVEVGIPPDRILGHCSLHGKDKLFPADRPITKVVVEVKHYGIIRRNGNTKLRNPSIVRIRYDKRISQISQITDSQTKFKGGDIV